MESRGGIANVVLIPVNNIKVTTDALNHGVEITLTNKSDYYKFPRWIAQDWKFTEEQSDTMQGDVYKVEISGKVPSKMFRIKDLEYIRSKSFYVLTEDFNNKVMLTGSEEVPVKCILKEDTSEDITSLNFTQFKIETTQAERSKLCAKVDMSVEF